MKYNKLHKLWFDEMREDGVLWDVRKVRKLLKKRTCRFQKHKGNIEE
jgi:hypothetical protein